MDKIGEVFLVNTVDVGMDGAANSGGNVGKSFQTNQVLRVEMFDGVGKRSAGGELNFGPSSGGVKDSDVIAGVFDDNTADAGIRDEDVGSMAEDGDRASSPFV